MEKLVRWHQWMDPERLPRHAGPFILFCVLSLIATPETHAALSHGNPAKDVRRLVISRDSASREWRGAIELPAVAVQPISGPQASEPPLVASEPDAVSGPPTEATHPKRAEPASSRDREQRVERALVRVGRRAMELRGRGGYLSEAGAVPLRFSATRSWPAPLPDEVRTAIRASSNEPARGGWGAVAQADSEPTLDVVVAEAIPEEDTMKLTADLIISYLESMDPGILEARVPFEPGIYRDGQGSLPSSLTTAAPQ